MMNKIKILFLTILCFGIIGARSNVAAQTGGDKILVTAGGKTLRQSDVNGLIKFYEWAFQTRFTSAQREQYAQLKAAEFSSNPAEAKKGNDEVNAFLAQADSMSQSEQTRVRNGFIKSFVPRLREATSDDEAQFLLGVYDAASDETAVNDADDSNDLSVGGDISSLVGKWVWSRSGSTTYTSGGAMLGSNGSRFTYDFSANGAVEYTGIMNVMSGGCSQQVFMSKKGRASLNGNTLTIKWSSGTSTRDFSCDRANNYTKTLPAEIETLKVGFQSNSTGQKLFCTGAEGQNQTCFSPTK